ncbi:hypothetical protein B0H19DRAFT_1088351 [Mycena capillaripes]|nr:hypothetical protein B0H19DRAFT_1088351 [Mycena capillaripes]
MVLPPQPTETGLKQIPGKFYPGATTFMSQFRYLPDAAHPFIAPGPNDQRGRKSLNSSSMGHADCCTGFNLDFNAAAGIATFAMLTRGNPFINKVSIGGVSPLIPPLPGKIDGPTVDGIAKHGRFEGDASMTRADAFIGDSHDFQEALYDLDLLQLDKFGDNGPDGENTVFNLQTLIGIKEQNIQMDQAADAHVSSGFHVRQH